MQISLSKILRRNSLLRMLKTSTVLSTTLSGKLPSSKAILLLLIQEASWYLTARITLVRKATDSSLNARRLNSNHLNSKNNISKDRPGVLMHPGFFVFLLLFCYFIIMSFISPMHFAVCTKKPVRTIRTGLKSNHYSVSDGAE